MCHIPNLLRIGILVAVGSSACFEICTSNVSFSLSHIWPMPYKTLLGFCIPSLSNSLMFDSYLWTGNVPSSRISVASSLNLSNCSSLLPVVIRCLHKCCLSTLWLSPHRRLHIDQNGSSGSLLKLMG